MTRNRRRQTAAVRYGTPAKGIVICLFATAAALGFLWGKAQLVDLGKQIKERQVRLVEMVAQNNIRRAQLEAACTPSALDARVRDLNLGLAPTPPAQVVRLWEPAPDMSQVAAGAGSARYAENRSGRGTP